MRDPERIADALEVVRRVWKTNPDLRLGQLLVIAAQPTEPCPEVFGIEDQALVDGLLRYETQIGSPEKVPPNRSMSLEHCIAEAFPSGIMYDDAAQLCLRLFCTADGIPSLLHQQCTKDNLAAVFAHLAAAGAVVGDTVTAALYGASFHSVTEKGHWVEIIASIFKKEHTRNSSRGEELAKALSAPFDSRI